MNIHPNSVHALLHCETGGPAMLLLSGGWSGDTCVFWGTPPDEPQRIQSQAGSLYGIQEELDFLLQNPNLLLPYIVVDATQ